MIDVEVTREDIRFGVPGDECRCAMALAIGRATGRPALVGGMVWGWLGLPGLAPLPEDAACWIIDFDRGMPVGPRHFIIESPMVLARAPALAR